MPDSVALPTYDTLLFAVEGPVASVTINRPEVLNALNAKVFTDLENLFTLLANDGSIRAIILTGAGPKAFAAGADISELAQTDHASAEALALRGQRIFRQLETCGKPIVCAINGFALGGGLELALACTFRIAADTAKLGQPEVKLGLLPGYGGSQRLPRLVGRSRALQLLLTGDPISASEALRIGLVDEVIPTADLLIRAQVLANQLAAQAPLAVSAILRAVDEGAGLPLSEALALEASHFGALAGTHDMHEGTRAFLEKRKPIWSGT